jgi:hypothetical protein
MKKTPLLSNFRPAPRARRPGRPGPRCLRRAFGACGALVLLPVVASAAVAGGPYRLAGIVAGGPGVAIALIELPDGRQRAYRAGDTLDGGTVREITAASVRIGLPDEDLILRLRGSPHVAPNAPPATDEGNAGADAEEHALELQAAAGAVRTLPLAPSDAERLLAAAGRADSAAGGDAPGADAGTVLRGVLELDADAVIVAVDGAPAASAAAALQALAAGLALGDPIPIEVSSAAGVQTLLLSPDPGQ